MILYLIRHGRQNASECNINVPLSEEGRRQAELLGKRMQHYPVDAVYCSDLIRAEQTARIAFSYDEELLQGLQVRSELQEVSFGDMTGIDDALVKSFYKEYYDGQIEAFTQNDAKRNLPEDIDALIGQYFVPQQEILYPGGESGKEVLQRFLMVFQELLSKDKENIAIVCHGGIIRVIVTALFGGDFARRLQFGTSLENCGITQIHFDREKNGFYLDRFNDYAHLEGHPELMRNVWKG